MRARRVEVGISLGLAALTLLAFGDLLWGGEYDFVSFDDYQYVRDNSHVQAGLTPDDLWWALTTFHAFNWHPLTWVSLQMDAQIFGVHPQGFHLTNLLLHTANALLLFWVLRRMTGAVWRAGAVAGFFALHPLHVESVAWVAERKDVLSSFFWMLTLLAYSWYAERPSVGRYSLVLLSLTLGLMSKPMLVTLPCVLLLLDYWPLRRWHYSPSDTVECSETSGRLPSPPRILRVSVWQLVLEKIPFFLLAAMCSVLTIKAQGRLIDDAQQAFPLGVRLLNVLVSYFSYLRQTFWPSDLAVFYSHPGEKLSLAQGLIAGAPLAAITVIAVCWWRSRPYLLVGWLWYLGTLVPVIGLLQVGAQARADRYTYIPLIGVFIMLAWGASELLARQWIGRVALAAATAALLVVCMALTAFQLRNWHNSTSLWDRALQVSGDDPRMYEAVVASCLQDREIDAAIDRAEVFRRLYPGHWKSHWLLGTALASKGRNDEAVESMARTLELQPEYPAGIHKRIAAILWSQDRIPAACQHYAALTRIQPDSAEARHYRGVVLLKEGRLADAVLYLEEAVRLDPDGVSVHVDLALALGDIGDVNTADSEYRTAFRINPDWPRNYDRLARLLATHPDDSRRDGKEAVRLARAACLVTNQRSSPFLETLAAAYAESGLFERAIATAERARQLAVEDGNKYLVDRLELALRRYKKGKPSRDTQRK